MSNINENLDYRALYNGVDAQGRPTVTGENRAKLYRWNNQQEAMGLPMLPYTAYDGIPQVKPNTTYNNPNAPAYEGGVYTQAEIDRAKRWADILNKKLGGTVTGGAAPIGQQAPIGQPNPYIEQLDRISFNPGVETAYSHILGETPEQQRARLIRDNINDRQWIQNNYMRYPEFYRNIINPMFEQEIEQRNQYLRNMGYTV